MRLSLIFTKSILSFFLFYLEFAALLCGIIRHLSMVRGVLQLSLAGLVAYNRVVKIGSLHGWRLSPSEARELQYKLAALVSRTNALTTPGYIAGVDISVDRARGMGRGAVVVLSYPELEVAEVQTVEDTIDFPYVPGLLSFREAPITLAACAKLKITPDLILVDGQGIAHPRRLGLASHLGLFLDVPTIGCAKSRLCGAHGALADEAGSYAELKDGDETIGAVLRTKAGVNPLYVSIGHKVDLESAVYWVLQCCRGYRLPEPTRLAHLAAGGNLKRRDDMTTVLQ
jgi:deoxyribonuclease V